MTDDAAKLVQIIEKYPAVYNNTLKEYSRKDYTEKAWAEIAEQMKWSVSQCKEKWKNIRNGFVRSLKQSPFGSKKPYYMHDMLEFVLPYIRPLQHLEQSANLELIDTDVCHNEEEATTENSEHDATDAVAEKRNHVFAPPSSAVKNNKKKLGETKGDVDIAVMNYITERKENKEDPRKMFLFSLQEDVAKLSDVRFRQFKIRSLILLEELLNEQDQETAYQQNQHSSLLVNAAAPLPIDPPNIFYTTADSDNSDSATFSQQIFIKNE